MIPQRVLGMCPETASDQLLFAKAEHLAVHNGNEARAGVGTNLKQSADSKEDP
jgi:hypothetical protein